MAENEVKPEITEGGDVNVSNPVVENKVVENTVVENKVVENVTEPIKEDVKETINPLQAELDTLKKQLEDSSDLKTKIEEIEEQLKQSNESNTKLNDFKTKQTQALLEKFSASQKEKFKDLDYDTILEISKMTKTTIQSQGFAHLDKQDANSKSDIAKKRYNSIRSRGETPPKGLFEEAYPD